MPTGGGGASIFNQAHPANQAILGARRAVLDAPGRLVDALTPNVVTQPGPLIERNHLFPEWTGLGVQSVRVRGEASSGGSIMPTGGGGGEIAGGGNRDSQSARGRQRALTGFPTAADDLDIGPTVGTGGPGGGADFSVTPNVRAPSVAELNADFAARVQRFNEAVAATRAAAQQGQGTSAPVGGADWRYLFPIPRSQQQATPLPGPFVPGLNPGNRPIGRPEGVDDVF